MLLSIVTRERIMTTMNISLTPQLESRVRDMVSSGQYASVSEVVRTALRLLEHQERLKEIQLQELREEVMAGMRQYERGEYSEVTDETLEDLEGRGRKRAKK